MKIPNLAYVQPGDELGYEYGETEVVKDIISEDGRICFLVQEENVLGLSAIAFDAKTGESLESGEEEFATCRSIERVFRNGNSIWWKGCSEEEEPKPQPQPLTMVDEGGRFLTIDNTWEPLEQITVCNCPICTYNREQGTIKPLPTIIPMSPKEQWLWLDNRAAMENMVVDEPESKKTWDHLQDVIHKFL